MGKATKGIKTVRGNAAARKASAAAAVAQAAISKAKGGGKVAKVVTGKAAGAPKATAAAVAVNQGAALRLPLPQAQAHNAGIKPAASAKQATAAAIALTSKGTNPTRQRVYGYANSSNGAGVPKHLPLALVPGFSGVPKAVNAGQWQLLQQQANGVTTVATLYANGITSRTVRRAWRAGAVQFVQPQAPKAKGTK